MSFARIDGIIPTLLQGIYQPYFSAISRIFHISIIREYSLKNRVSFLLVRFWYAVKSAMYLSISTVEFFIKIFLWYSTVNNYKALVW